MAWLVLEELVLGADLDEHGRLVSATSARALASHFRLDKDCVARALRRLAALGIVARRRQARDDGGRFGAAVLELRLPVGITPQRCPAPPDTVIAHTVEARVVPQLVAPRPEEGAPTLATPVEGHRDRAARRSRTAAQLSLLDARSES